MATPQWDIEMHRVHGVSIHGGSMVFMASVYMDEASYPWYVYTWGSIAFMTYVYMGRHGIYAICIHRESMEFLGPVQPVSGVYWGLCQSCSWVRGASVYNETSTCKGALQTVSVSTEPYAHTWHTALVPSLRPSEVKYSNFLSFP